ncbi:MAG: hypothetical protein QOF12_848, partial [Solirubrobacteraceae bacterium]|nr:hypothetical protein [Solirubrobacteraceae bacterium]
MLKRLRFGEKLAAVSALALLGFLFLDWYGSALPANFLVLSGRAHNGGIGIVVVSGHSDGWHTLGWLTLALCVLAIIAGLALPFVVAAYESPVLPVFT